MTRCFLGVDIGGTKSHALIADEHGQALGFAEGGTGNHESVGYDGLTAVLQHIVAGALESAGLERGQISAAGFGIAGFDWRADIAPTRAAIETLGLTAPFEFVNDATIGLLAGATNGWGVSVIAGTGCNARGRDLSGREGRVTGEGALMGEFGGGSSLAFRAVQDIAMAWTKRGAATLLTDLFLAEYGAPDVEDFLEGLCRGRYHLRSSSAPLVFQAAAQGDAVALDAVRWMGRELGSLAVGVIRQMAIEAEAFEVVLAGSLYKGSPLLTDSLVETVRAIAPRAQFVPLDAPPVVGGVILAMQQVGAFVPAVRERLIETTTRFLSATVSGV